MGAKLMPQANQGLGPQAHGAAGFGNYPKIKPKKKKKKGTPVRRPGMTLEQWATLQAEQYRDADLAAIDRQQQIYLDELRRQSDLAAQQGAALAQAMAALGAPGAIQGVYQNAAQSQAGLAQGFSGALQETAAADAAEQMNMLSGTGQEGAVRNQGENMGNVLYGVGGYIPGKNLGETGAAFAADAANQPMFAQQEAVRRAQEMFEEGLGGLTDFSQARIEAESGMYDRTQEIMSRRQQILDDRYEREYEKYQDDRDYALKMAAFYAAQGKDKKAEQWRRKAHQLDVRQQKRLEQKDKGLDVNGNPLPGYEIKNGKVVKTSKPKEPKAANWGGIQQDIAQDIPNLTTEIDDPEDYHIPPRKIEVPMDYQQAFDRLWAEYSGLVKNKGRLKRLINQLLAKHGIKKPSPQQHPSLSGDYEYPGGV